MPNLGVESPADGAARLILVRMATADRETLRRAKYVKAAALLHEHDPQGRGGEPVPWPPLPRLVNSILEGLQADGLVPRWLSAEDDTAIVRRQLRAGIEIGPGCGLTSDGYYRLVAGMLAEAVDVSPLTDWTAFGARGDSIALGFHVLGLIVV